MTSTTLALTALRRASARGWLAPKDLAPRAIQGLRELEVVPSGPDEQRTAKIAGFADSKGKTLAGLSTVEGLVALASLRSIAGNLDKGEAAKQIDVALARTRGWLDAELRFDRVPAEGASIDLRYYSYLWRIAQAGELLSQARFGGLDWYAAGARRLLGLQREDGAFGGAPWAERRKTAAAPGASPAGTPKAGKPEKSDGAFIHGYNSVDYTNTALALLFLVRASETRSGGSSEARIVRETTPKPDGSDELLVRVRDGSQIRLGVIGLGAQAAKTQGNEPLQIEKVEFCARDVRFNQPPSVITTLGAQVLKPEELGRLTADLALRRGSWRVLVRITLRAQPSRTLLSDELVAWVIPDPTDADLSAASDRTRNLLATVPVKASASSQSGNPGPDRVFDGELSTLWACEPDDKEPWIRLALAKPVTANRLVFTHALPRPSCLRIAQAEKLEVAINDAAPLALEMNQAPNARTVLTLPRAQPIRSILVKIVTSQHRREGWGVGFAEIELQMEP